MTRHVVHHFWRVLEIWSAICSRFGGATGLTFSQSGSLNTVVSVSNPISRRLGSYSTSESSMLCVSVFVAMKVALVDDVGALVVRLHTVLFVLMHSCRIKLHIVTFGLTLTFPLRLIFVCRGRLLAP